MTHEIYLNEKEAQRIVDGDKMFLVRELNRQQGGYQRGDSIKFIVTKTGFQYKGYTGYIRYAKYREEKPELEELTDNILNKDDHLYMITYVEPIAIADGVNEDGRKECFMDACVIGFRKGM